MTDNKNMLKTHNNRVALKTIKKQKFYGIVEYSVKVKDEKGEEKSVTKTAVVTAGEATTRLQAKREVEQSAKAMKGKLKYFGAFRNK